MSQYRALIVSSPGSRGESAFSHALKTVGFDVEVLHVNELLDMRLDQDQLCLKYKIVILPSGNTYASILGSGKILALKLLHGLGWNLTRFAERGGLVLGTGTGFQTLMHMKVFGDDYALRLNDQAIYVERWMKVIPTGTRCVWLKGLGVLELPIDHRDTEFVIDPFAFVEAKGKLERLGLGCLKDEKGEKTIGLCDQTGRIFGMIPNPEFFLSWTNMDDWLMNPTRAAAPGQGLAIFENAAKYLNQ